APVAPHCTLLSPPSWTNNAKSLVCGPTRAVLTCDDATGAKLTIEANARVMEPAKATCICFFMCPSSEGNDLWVESAAETRLTREALYRLRRQGVKKKRCSTSLTGCISLDARL